MKNLLKTVIITASIFNFGSICGSAEIERFKACSDVWGVVGDFCDVQALATLAQVSSRVNLEPQRQLHNIKKWQDEGGLLIAMFGNPKEEDKKNYYCLKGAEIVPLRMNADEIKRVLLSFTHIADSDVVAELSDVIEGYIEGSVDLSGSAKEQLKMLLPNSKNGYMSGHLDARNLLGGDSLELSSEDQQKIFVRILMQPWDVSEYSGEINNVFSYLWRSKATNARNARLYIKNRLEAKDLRVLDLCLLQCCSELFGAWDESDIAINRMMEHPEMNKWLKIYCILIAKPWTDNVIKPVMQYYRTLSWLGRKVVKIFNK